MTAPMFVLFLMASFEFGWLNVLRHTADNAAYEAARLRDGAGRNGRRSEGASQLDLENRRSPRRRGDGHAGDDHVDDRRR